MDQVPPVGYPRQQQQQAPHTMNGGMMMQSGPALMADGPINNFSPYDPPAMANPGIDTPMGSQIPGRSAMSPGMGGPWTQNMTEQMQYHQGVHEITRALAMANLSRAGVGNTTNPGMRGPRAPNMTEQPQYHQRVNEISRALAMANLSGGAGPPTPGEPPFNQSPGQRQTPFPGPQNSQLGQNRDGGSQVSTAPPTPSDMSRSITPPSPSMAVNRGPAGADVMQPPPVGATSGFPDVPDCFLTTEFMQSVARTLEDFDKQTLFSSEDTGINWEDFREWFNPDDLVMK